MRITQARRQRSVARRNDQYTIEPLERRVLLAAVNWTGLGDGVNWSDPANWSSNPQLPGITDDVTIPQGFMVTVNSSVPTVQSVMISATLVVSAGSLTVTNGGQIIGGNVQLSGGALTASTHETNPLYVAGGGALTMTGGTLFGDIHFALGGGLFWTGGEMASPGAVTSDSGSYPYSTIGGSVRLSRLLDWAGRDVFISGNIELRSGATFDFSSVGHTLHMTDCTVTDGGGAKNVFRVNRTMELEGESFIFTETDLSNVTIIEVIGGNSGVLHLLGGGTGNLGIIDGSEIHIGEPGYSLVGVLPKSAPLDGQFFFDAGMSTFSGTADSITVSGADTRLTFSDTSTLNQLAIGTGAFATIEPGTVTVNGPVNLSGTATLALAPGGSVVLDARSIVITGPTAILNLADNVVIVDYTAKDGGPLADIKGYITSGYNNGAWNGIGINSSVAATTPNHGIGYAASADLFSSFPAIFAGQQVDDTAILVRYTRYGDANLDRTVNLADFNRLAASFGQADTLWSQGNFNFDSTTNLADFNLLAANFGQTASRAAMREAFASRRLVDVLLSDDAADAFESVAPASRSDSLPQ